MAEKKLTDKQEMFCREYLVDFNATQAAIRAGYSANSANAIGNENLLKPIIQKRLKELQEPKLKKLDISAERTLKEVGRLAFANITNVVSVEPMMIEEAETNLNVVVIKNLDELSEDVTAAISELSNTRDGVKVKMHNKEGSLEKLMRYHGLYEKDNDQSSGSTLDLSKLDKDELITLMQLRLKAKKVG